MTYLPTQPHEVLATKADLTSVRDELGTRIGFVQAGVSAVQTDVIALRTEINGRIDSVNRRLDRLHLTLAAGLLALLGAAIVQAVL